MLKKKNGITLIALIITIIVMLILVGVTINIAINGGLFTKAKEAVTELEKTSIHEQIIMGMQLSGGKIDVEETFKEAQKTLSEYTVTEKSSGANYKVITVVGKNGTYTYTITDEEILIGEKVPEPEDEFGWFEKFGLSIDTEADYEYDIYVLNFSEDGKIYAKENGTQVPPINAKEIPAGNLVFPFTVGGQEYSTTLTMNANGVDLDAELKDFTTVTFVKKTEVSENIWKNRGLTADIKFDTNYTVEQVMTIAFQSDGTLYATTGNLTNEEIESGMAGTNENLSVTITSNTLTFDYVSQEDFKIEVENISKLNMYMRNNNDEDWTLKFSLEPEN